jgi:hypothetical protein
MDGLTKNRFFVPGSLAIIFVLSIYNAYIFWPSSGEEAREEAQVVEHVAVDPQVTQRALGYLVKQTDVAKVVIHDNQVFIGFAEKPEAEALASTVQKAALTYAEAIGGDVYVHGTHEQQMGSIGTPEFNEYCNAHATVSNVLGPEGKMVNQAAIIEGTC